MAHSHAHSEPENTYFLDQLCTIAVAGLLGFTAIGLYVNGWLQTKFNLIERFHIPVLVAGIVLILLALLRAVAVWQQAGVVLAPSPLTRPFMVELLPLGSACRVSAISVESRIIGFSPSACWRK